MGSKEPACMYVGMLLYAPMRQGFRGGLSRLQEAGRVSPPVGCDQASKDAASSSSTAGSGLLS